MEERRSRETKFPKNDKSCKKFQKGVDKTAKTCYNKERKPKGAQSLGAIAGVAELADARDLKSRDTKVSYRFDPGYRHHRG